MSTFIVDLRHAVRVLRKSPGFTAVAVLTLALGIGANTAMFSVLHQVLLRPLPFDKPDTLVALWMRFVGLGLPNDRNWVSVPELMDLREHAQSFSHIAAFRGALLNVRLGEAPENLVGALVSPSFFPALGVEPELGRVFLPEEEQAGRQRVAVISHALWQRSFGGDADIVGRLLQIDGESARVVGVMPATFDFPDDTVGFTEPVGLWLPLVIGPEEVAAGARSNHGLQVIARIRDGLSFEQAQADLARVSQRIIEGAPDYHYEEVGFRVLMNPLLDQMVEGVRPALLVLMGAVAFVLLIACANVASLLLARTAEREREIAIRAALGAGRGRLLRQLLTESLVLSVGSAAAGLLFANWALAALAAGAGSSVPRLHQVGLDLPVLGFALLVAVATSVIFGLAPALRSVRGSNASALKEGGRTVAGGTGHWLKLGVVAEVALSLVLLAGAGLLVRSFLHLLEVDPGFRGDHVLTMRLSLPESRYGEGASSQRFYDELRRRVASLPGVESAGFTSALPLAGEGSSGTTTLDTQAVTPDQASPEADRRCVTPGLFRALGITLVSGRDFDERDTDAAAPVAIIDETMARRFWPNQDAIGRRLKLGGPGGTGPWRTVVGVVRHVRYEALESPSRVEVYWPHSQRPQRSMALAVRTNAASQAMVDAIRAQVLELDPDQPIRAVRTMQEILGQSTARRRLAMGLLTAFAALALGLAALGIYGVVSYSVGQRAREVGIRMAMGASRGQVLWAVMRQSLELVLAGVAVGLVAGLALTRLLGSLLYETSPSDPVAFGLGALLLAGLAALASYLPACRAARLDPAAAVRCE
jgi:putative ABC transport system permease protein